MNELPQHRNTIVEHLVGWRIVKLSADGFRVAGTEVKCNPKGVLRRENGPNERGVLYPFCSKKVRNKDLG